jgi:hypothetical protein
MKPTRRDVESAEFEMSTRCKARTSETAERGHKPHGRRNRGSRLKRRPAGRTDRAGGGQQVTQLPDCHMMILMMVLVMKYGRLFSKLCFVCLHSMYCEPATYPPPPKSGALYNVGFQVPQLATAPENCCCIFLSSVSPFRFWTSSIDFLWPVTSVTSAGEDGYWSPYIPSPKVSLTGGKENIP